MSNLCPPQLVSAPTTVAPKYGLYSVATVLDDQERAGCGVVYLPEAVTPSGFVFAAQCGGAALASLGLEPSSVAGDGFWVVNGVQCFRDDIEAAAAARMAMTEQELVEHQIWTNTLGLTDGPEFDKAGTVNLTSGGAVSLAVGLGLLEKYLGENYEGTGVIHSSRLVAPAAGRDLLVSKSGSKLSTLLDTPWAFGQGYPGSGPNNVSPAAGTTWLYATGQVVVRRGAMVHWAFADALDKTTNNVTVLVERPVNVTLDGILAAALVTL